MDLRSSSLNKKTNLDELSSSFLFSKDDLRSKKDELRPNFVQWVRKNLAYITEALTVTLPTEGLPGIAGALPFIPGSPSGNL